MTIRLIRRLAIVFGVLLPIVETIRRRHQLGDLRIWPFWLDDWAIGGFFLMAAWKTRKSVERGHAWLAAACGFGMAIGYVSFFSQLANLAQPDPSGVSSTVVVAIKGVLLALAICALVIVLRWREPQSVR